MDRWRERRVRGDGVMAGGVCVDGWMDTWMER